MIIVSSGDDLLNVALQAAGNAVKRATEALVRSAQQVKEEMNGEDTELNVSDKMVGGLAQVGASPWKGHTLQISIQISKVVPDCFFFFILPLWCWKLGISLNADL